MFHTIQVTKHSQCPSATYSMIHSFGLTRRLPNNLHRHGRPELDRCNPSGRLLGRGMWMLKPRSNARKRSLSSRDPSAHGKQYGSLRWPHGQPPLSHGTPARWPTSFASFKRAFVEQSPSTRAPSEQIQCDESWPRLALNDLADEPQDPPALPPAQVPLIPPRRSLAGGRHGVVPPADDIPLIPEVPVVA